MPIFQDDLPPPVQHPERSYRHGQSPVDTKTLPLPIETCPRPSRRFSEESIRTEFCEGPIPDSPRRPSTSRSTEYVDKQEPEAPVLEGRAELIERLKRVASPGWTPNKFVSKMGIIMLQLSCGLTILPPRLNQFFTMIPQISLPIL